MKKHTIKLQKNSVPDREFQQSNYDILFERLKLVSYMLIFTYPCFFIVDFFFLQNLNQPAFKWTLKVVHLFGLAISLVFIMLYRHSKRHTVSKSFIVNSYISLYLLIGAVSSINSQLNTGNIYAYLIILFAAAIIFPIRPKHMLMMMLGAHLISIAGLSFLGKINYSFVLNLVNSTGAAVIAFTIALTFYRFRKSDFFNKRKLTKNEESFRRLFQRNPNPLILINLDNEIQLVNQQAIHYYQLEGKELAALDAGFLFGNPAEKQDIMKRLYEENSVKNYVTEQQLAPGQKKWSLLHFELVDYHDETCVLIDTTDITDIKKKEQELMEHASIDVLTGVRNRRSGIELLRHELSAGPTAREFILFFIDINGLKKVNDHLGHAIGDDLIRTCCETIERHIQCDDFLFRLGGDEFIIVFFEKEIANVEQVWMNIEDAFKNINDAGQKPYKISASHGFYHYKPGTPVTLDEILEFADQEMYKNKFNYKAQNKSVYTLE
ncbi:GGDEF domain-containing protein [Neobacillus sp. SAB-20_R2A]|uniref:GGDEF domain-containing protein n=1 Tax=Neobacillus sp. SAB-20_R2A TaxID=3120519 RepID=UPI003C6E9BD2